LSDVELCLFGYIWDLLGIFSDSYVEIVVEPVQKTKKLSKTTMMVVNACLACWICLYGCFLLVRKSIYILTMHF